MLKVVHYINQFFGQIGGEDKADTPPLVKEGPVGPGLALQQALGDQGKVVATIICGDSYFNEHVDEALAEILGMVDQYQPDLFVAGPAFFAGRYGIACATVCKAVQEKFGIPVVTGMYPENPGVDLCKKDVYVIKTGDSAAQMKDAVTKMVKLALKLVNKEEIGSPEEEGYIPRGIRKNYFAQERGSKRAVDMLVKKLKGEPYTTELPMPEFDRVPPAPAVKDISKALVALVTSGGIVPKGNPDHIESSSASKFGKYDLEGIEALSPETHQTAHGGYDPVYANEDPNRVLPVDVMRELEKEGKIGKLHRYYYATVGNGTPVAKAQQYGQAIAKELKDAGVQAVILTSTWGTCTRCGATMVKELERAGLPTVHICTIVPISKTVGANRIVPAVAIPHPLGNPELSKEEEKALRRKIIGKALEALQTDIDTQTVFEWQ